MRTAPVSPRTEHVVENTKWKRRRGRRFRFAEMERLACQPKPWTPALVRPSLSLSREHCSRRARRGFGLLSDDRVPKSHYSVFRSLYRPSPDDFPGRLCLEYRGLLRERIDAAPLLCCGLFNYDEFGKSGHKESCGSIEFLVANRRERLDDAFDVFPRQVRMLFSDFLNQL